VLEELNPCLLVDNLLIHSCSAFKDQRELSSFLPLLLDDLPTPEALELDTSRKLKYVPVEGFKVIQGSQNGGYLVQIFMVSLLRFPL
jgi:hypothetical protein